MKNTILGSLIALFLAAPVVAEEAVYGSVYLGGLDRDVTWPHNDFNEHNSMVCNVNGPDGFLTVRSGPGSDFKKVRAFKRLAVLVVDISERRGNWVRVVDGYRTHTSEGVPQDFKALPVSGWAHDGYLCSFLD
ncbi:SH3 domain-containing protein [Planktotalea sp.]|uniref:SH3 domain-containing protein n=1 Tax=Planktotalea sp. TaxID=2029877 RepID=UPI0032997E51